jgi:hypothetical protein
MALRLGSLGGAALLCLCAAGPPALAANAEEPTIGPTFKEGDVITFDKIEELKPYLPPEFWDNREFFFYDGMRMRIGPTEKNYTPAEAYENATHEFRGQARIGPENSLENYTAGQPFPMDQIDCRGDPNAGAKIMWDFDYRWEGDGTFAHFLYTYWDRGEQLPLYYEGTSRTINLSHRVEPEYLKKQDGDLFKHERRKYAFGIEVTAPFDSRGTDVLTYRYKSTDGPPAQAKNDDTWVYLPTLRRVRRISTAQRTDAISGTDFTFDDLRSFSGIVPQYKWECLGKMDLVAPMNSEVRAYPYQKGHNFGPYGLSFADDVWELRHAVKVRMIPTNPEHPYHHKDIYIDTQTLEPLYSFAYDQKEELWKIIWHDHRWSADEPEYKGWDDIKLPRDDKVVSDIILNVQTGTGNRIEFWDANGTPLKSLGRVRRYIDIGRLTHGR